MIRDAIMKMFEKGVIEPSNSPWSSPIVLVEKKNSEYRYCTDYRKLDAITKKDRHPLPRIDDLLGKLKGADYFSAFDLASRFWQIAIYPSHKKNTAFIKHCGFFQYHIMPFGLCNAPATLQLAIEHTLADYPVFIDDVIVHKLVKHKTHNNHLAYIPALFDVVRNYNLKLGLKNAFF